MNDKSLQVLLVEDNVVAAQLVKTMLARADPSICDVQVAVTLMDALDLLGTSVFDVILLDLSLPDSDGLETLTTIRVHAPHIPVLVLTGSDNEALSNSALQHGAQDYIVKGQFDGNTLTRALRYAVTRHKQASQKPADDAPRGTVVGVLGAKGGVGGSTVAAHLAIEIRRLTNQEVLLVDLDVTGGTVGFLMKVDQRYTLLDASFSLHRLDAALWKSLVWKHSTGLDVLQSPGSTRFGDQLRDERVRHLLHFAQSRYAWIVVDMGRFTELSINLVGHTNQLLLVSTADVPTLYEAKRIAQKLNEIGHAIGETKLVMNRASRAEMDVQELEKTFAMPINCFCPEACRDLHEAYAEGRLLSPGSSLCKQIVKLARDVTGVAIDPDKSAVRSFFGLRRSA
jgi:pilus assembly protein CpaE